MNKKIYDFIIIGSGPAGSTLAFNLANQNYRIALVDRATNIKKKSDKNDFIFSPYINNCPNYYSPLFSNQLGGNSALWNNKIYLISKEEFNSSSWPFSYTELVKYSKDLAKKFKINHRDIFKVENDKKLNYSFSLREKRLGNLFFFLKISQFSNIDIFESSSPVSVNLNKNKKKIISITINNINKKIYFDLHLKNALIFCAGGLGNANIISNLFKKRPNIIGKNLCDHPHINLSNIKNDEAKTMFKFGKYFISSANEKKEKNLFLKFDNYFLGTQLDFIPDPSRILKRVYIRFRSIVTKQIMSVIIKYYSLFVKIINKIFSILNIKGKYSLEFFFSQKPNRSNSLILDSNKKDEYGLLKSNLNWKISDKDKKKYIEMINFLIGKNGKLLKRNKIKNINYNKILVGLHPSCTTKVDKNIKKSCLNKNLKLNGYQNVYVCGSSVFNRNGFTNPTWTIMTLSNRLSSFLNKIF